MADDLNRDAALNKAFRDQRIGRFMVMREELLDGFGPIIFRDMIPLEVRPDFGYCGGSVVTAVCPEFDPGTRGMWPARYRCRIEPIRGSEGTGFIRRFEKIEEPPIPTTDPLLD